jgi:hypothetical protein
MCVCILYGARIHIRPEKAAAEASFQPNPTQRRTHRGADDGDGVAGPRERSRGVREEAAPDEGHVLIVDLGVGGGF